jgi:hemerythrin
MNLQRSEPVGSGLWHPLPETGIRQMEEEHDSLLRFLGELREAMVAGEGNIRLREILGDLMNHSTEQFSSQEELMAKYRFPYTLEHTRDHQAIQMELNQLIVGHDMGHGVYSGDLARVLQRWIYDHVTRHDMKLAEFLMMNGEV